MKKQKLIEINYDPEDQYDYLLKDIKYWRDLYKQYQNKDIVLEYYKYENFRFYDIIIVCGLKQYQKSNIQVLKKFSKIKLDFDCQQFNELEADIEIADTVKNSVIKTQKQFQQGKQDNLFNERQYLQIMEHVPLITINPYLINDILEDNVRYQILENYTKQDLETYIAEKLFQKQQNLPKKEKNKYQGLNFVQQSQQLIQQFFILNLADKLNIITKQNTLKIYKDFQFLIDDIIKIPQSYQQVYDKKSITVCKKGNVINFIFSNNLKEHSANIKISNDIHSQEKYIDFDDKKMKQVLYGFRPHTLIVIADDNFSITQLKTLYSTLKYYQEFLKYDIKIVRNEIINELQKISETFSSQQNFYNMYFSNPVDLTILKYEKKMLENIKTPIDIDLMDYLIQNFLRYKFFQRGIILSYLSNKDYQKVLQKVINKEEYEKIILFDFQNKEKFDIDERDHQYYYFYKILSQENLVNKMKFHQIEKNTISAIYKYIQNFHGEKINSLFQGMLNDLFYSQNSASNIRYFIQMIQEISSGLVIDKQILKFTVARCFLELFPEKLYFLQLSQYNVYFKYQFFPNLLKEKNLKIMTYQIVKIKIVDVKDDYIKGYYKNAYTVYLSQRKTGLQRYKSMKDYYSKNEIIEGNVIQIDDKYMKLDIIQNLSKKDKAIKYLEGFLYEQYNLKDYQIVIQNKDIRFVKRVFLKRNFDFIDLVHQKFMNKTPLLTKAKLKKETDQNSINYYIIPAERKKRYRLQSKIYIQEIDQFFTVPIYHDNKQKENFDDNVIDLQGDQNKDKQEYYYVNKFEKIIDFSQFVQYFEQFMKLLQEVQQDINFNQDLTNNLQIQYRFQDIEKFVVEVIYFKQDQRFISQIQIGKKLYFKNLEFNCISAVTDFINKNKENFEDQKYVVNLLELELSIDQQNQLEMISNITSNINTNQGIQKNFDKFSLRQTDKSNRYQKDDKMEECSVQSKNSNQSNHHKKEGLKKKNQEFSPQNRKDRRPKNQRRQNKWSQKKNENDSVQLKNYNENKGLEDDRICEVRKSKWDQSKDCSKKKRNFKWGQNQEKKSQQNDFNNKKRSENKKGQEQNSGWTNKKNDKSKKRGWQKKTDEGKIDSKWKGNDKNQKNFRGWANKNDSGLNESKQNEQNRDQNNSNRQKNKNRDSLDQRKISRWSQKSQIQSKKVSKWGNQELSHNEKKQKKEEDNTRDEKSNYGKNSDSGWKKKKVTKSWNTKNIRNKPKKTINNIWSQHNANTHIQHKKEEIKDFDLLKKKQLNMD